MEIHRKISISRAYMCKGEQSTLCDSRAMIQYKDIILPVKEIRSYDYLISTVGIQILTREHFCINTGKTASSYWISHQVPLLHNIWGIVHTWTSFRKNELRILTQDWFRIAEGHINGGTMMLEKVLDGLFSNLAYTLEVMMLSWLTTF